MIGLRYRHEVSLDWLRERQRYLTASDVRLMAADAKAVKEGRKKLLQCRSFARVLGSKMNASPSVEAPSSAAARGHFMEPYAVEEWEALNRRGLRHWDDFLLANDDGLAFSPDALDVDQPSGVSIVVSTTGSFVLGEYIVRPTRMLEVKCYEDGAHFQRKLDVRSGRVLGLDERWQVAMGMAVCPAIETGTIMFYAPQCNDWFDVTFGRSELEDEMDFILYMNELWRQFVSIMMVSMHHPTVHNEDELYQRYLAEVALDAG